MSPAGLELLGSFLAGGIGTVCRVLLSPVLDNTRGRLAVQAIVGAVVGVLAAAMVPVQITLTTPGMQGPAVAAVLKAAAVFLLTYTGSLTVGEVQARLGLAPTSKP